MALRDVLDYPAAATGVAVSTGGTTWTHNPPLVDFVTNLPTDLALASVEIIPETAISNPNVDTTLEFELIIWDDGTAVAWIPFSIRFDTTVGPYLMPTNQRIAIPEPIYVAAGSTLSATIVGSVTSFSFRVKIRGADLAEIYTDSGTVTLTLTPQSTEIYSRVLVDSDTVPLVFTPSGTDEHTVGSAEYLDSGTVPLALTPSGSEGQHREDTGTLYLDLQPNATVETKVSVDTGTVQLALTPSGTEGRITTEPGSVTRTILNEPFNDLTAWQQYADNSDGSNGIVSGEWSATLTASFGYQEIDTVAAYDLRDVDAILEVGAIANGMVINLGFEEVIGVSNAPILEVGRAVGGAYHVRNYPNEEIAVPSKPTHIRIRDIGGEYNYSYTLDGGTTWFGFGSQAYPAQDRQNLHIFVSIYGAADTASVTSLLVTASPPQAYLALTPSGTEGVEHVDSGTVTLALTPITNTVGVAYDSFTDTDTTALTSHTPEKGTGWTAHPSNAGTLSIRNNKLVSEGAYDVIAAYINDAPASADQIVKAAITRLAGGSNEFWAITARMDSSALTEYRFGYSDFSGQWILSKFVAGTETVLDTDTVAVTAGRQYSIELRVIGTTIEGYVDGVLVCNATDSGVTAAGRVGIQGYGSSAAGTAWQMDDYNATAAYSTETFQGVDSGTVTLWLRPLTSGGYDSTILSDSPTYYWKLHEASGTAAEEEIANSDGTYNNTPTLGEPALTADGVSSVHLNDAQNEYVSLGAILGPATYNSSGVTLEIWFKRDTLSTGIDQGIFGTWISGPSDNGGPMIWLDHLTGNLRGVWNLAGVANYLDAGFQPGASVYHVVLAYDAATDELFLYVNGSLVDSATGVTQLGDSNTWAIGRYNNDNNLDFAGWVERAALYVGALSAGRVQAHYLAGTSGGAVETFQGVDAATVPLTFTPSGTDTYETSGTVYTDSGTVVLALTPSGADIQEAQDAGTVPLVFNPSGVELLDTVDTGTVPLTLSPSGTEILQYVDAGTVPVQLTPSGSELQEAVDSATATIQFTPSGVETAQFIDSGTVSLTYTVTGTDEYAAIDATTVNLRFTVSAVEEYTAPGRDEATVPLAFTVSSVEYTEYVDSATVTFLTTPSGSDTLERTSEDSGTVPITLSPSGVEIAQYLDDGTVPLLFSPSGTSTADFEDAASVQLYLSPSGVDEYGQTFDYADSGTIYLHLTPITSTLYGLVLSSRAFARWNDTATKTYELVTKAFVVWRSTASGRWTTWSFRKVLSRV